MSTASNKDQTGHLAYSATPRALSNKADTRCVFCERIKNGEYDDSFANYVWFEPLNPVTPGHMLVVPKVHTANLNSVDLEADQVGWALRYFTNDLEQDYNIITSSGKNATQTIQHLHFHIVPRTADDGLHLPWTNQVRRTEHNSSDQEVSHD